MQLGTRLNTCRLTHTINDMCRVIYLMWCPGQNKRIARLSFFHGCRKKRLKD
jgi:hypothetical protein